MLNGAGAVIFDYDDTLAATAECRWDVLIATAAEFGVELAPKVIGRAWGQPFDALIRALVPTVDHEKYLCRYREAMKSTEIRPCAGASDLLDLLSSKNVTMEIVSSSSLALILQDLDQLGLTRHFGKIYGQEQTRYHKPDPRVLADVVQDLHRRGFTQDKLVYIGDSARDYAVAAGNEIEFIAVLSGVESRADLENSGVPRWRIIDDLKELLGGATNGTSVPALQARAAEAMRPNGLVHG